jgi:mannose-6-phosphate isomerase-like protein (cupin superfamily)
VAVERGETQALILQPGEGEAVTLGPNRITFKLGGAETGGAFSVIEYAVGPNFQAPPTPHFHTNECWAAYVLEGTVGLDLDGQTVMAPAGTFFLVPKGLPFKWWNAEDRPARYLGIYFPAGFERYFAEVAGLTKDLPPGPVDTTKLMPKLLPLWEKYGIGTVGEGEKS